MAVNLKIPSASEIFPVSGVQIGIACAGIRHTGRPDLTVFRLAPGTTVAGVFTSNRFRAAPVQVCENHLAQGQSIAALVVNTGNANAGTGASGLVHAHTTCQELAQLLKVEATQILPFSTGVILEPLPVDRLVAALPQAVHTLSPQAWSEAATSIMTTDTQPKITSQRRSIAGHTTTFTGISKGAGMIRPNMATMLGFLATDVGIAQPLLQEITQQVADRSFNRITVDGDTSTNDAFIIMATGQSGLNIDTQSHPSYTAVTQALTAAALELAQKIIRDAEGATKFITIHVDTAANPEEALKVAYAVAHSPLVKTAFYASDPNLGRILAAIGYAGIETLDVNQVSLWLDDVLVAQGGARHPDYREEEGQRIMQQAEIAVRIALGRGQVSETLYTCDLSHQYVSINADYRS